MGIVAAGFTTAVFVLMSPIEPPLHRRVAAIFVVATFAELARLSA
jgi:hypothetical protein